MGPRQCLERLEASIGGVPAPDNIVPEQAGLVRAQSHLFFAVAWLGTVPDQLQEPLVVRFAQT
jgi:hypothetical protein